MNKNILVWIVVGLSLMLGLFLPSALKPDIEETFPIETTITTTEVTEIVETTIAPTETTEPVETTIAAIQEADPLKTTESTEEFVDPNEWFVTDFDIIWYSDYRVYSTQTSTTTICGEEIDKDFLAKMVFAEAGGENWMGKLYTCSAILNHCEKSNMTLWDCGHNASHFAVAPYVDRLTPTQECYEVVNYVLNGGRIAEICYFRTGYYHSFGTPICKVDNHYFSK